MEKPIEASNASRKLYASLIKNVDGKIRGKDELLAPNQVNSPMLASDGGSRVSGSTDTLNPSLQKLNKDIITQSDVNSDVFWSDNNVTNVTVLGTKEKDQHHSAEES
nr:hypothetical protein [Tanacetum cinerariifolium]